jgi:hypothetical protein
MSAPMKLCNVFSLIVRVEMKIVATAFADQNFKMFLRPEIG